jgi:hypothetical protein
MLYAIQFVLSARHSGRKGRQSCIDSYKVENSGDGRVEEIDILVAIGVSATLRKFAHTAILDKLWPPIRLPCGHRCCGEFHALICLHPYTPFVVDYFE